MSVPALVSKTTEEYRQALEEVLRESGEKELLKECLRVKLAEAGWCETMARWCREQIESKTINTPLFPKSASDAAVAAALPPPPTLPPAAPPCSLASRGITEAWFEKDAMEHALATIPDYVKADILVQIRNSLLKTSK